MRSLLGKGEFCPIQSLTKSVLSIMKDTMDKTLFVMSILALILDVGGTTAQPPGWIKRYGTTVGVCSETPAGPQRAYPPSRGWGVGLARMPCPKQRHPWARVAHRGTRGTLDEFKAAWVGRLAHHGGTPKILPGNLPPAAIADRWIGLQPYSPHRRSYLVGNLTYSTDRHNVLHKVYKGAVGGRR
jgi:hypothetical protein